jgi:hypothetical protein
MAMAEALASPAKGRSSKTTDRKTERNGWSLEGLCIGFPFGKRIQTKN